MFLIGFVKLGLNMQSASYFFDFTLFFELIIATFFCLMEVHFLHPLFFVFAQLLCLNVQFVEAQSKPSSTGVIA